MIKALKKALEKAGLPVIRFHDLRHTAATLMLSKGVHPKIVSETLGHGDVAFTLTVYSHVLTGCRRVPPRPSTRPLGVNDGCAPSVPGTGVGTSQVPTTTRDWKTTCKPLRPLFPPWFIDGRRDRGGTLDPRDNHIFVMTDASGFFCIGASGNPEKKARELR